MLTKQLVVRGCGQEALIPWTPEWLPIDVRVTKQGSDVWLACQLPRFRKENHIVQHPLVGSSKRSIMIHLSAMRSVT